jgi:chain length determinant protein tyrosine kinase EpsG
VDQRARNVHGQAEGVTGNLEERTIGRILVDMGRLTERDVHRVFKLQRKHGLRFGEAARRLRLLGDEDIEYALSIQFNYPYLKRGQGALGPELVVAHDPFDSQSEAIRDLRTQLLMQWGAANRKVLAVVSPDSRDGRSYLAANLAVAFGQLGERTLLVDADLRVPRQHRIFGLPGGHGLAQVLSGRGGLGNADAVPYFEGLSVLAAGTAPPNPLELLSREAFARLLTQARNAFSVVVVDTAAVARGADAKVVAARSDGVLLLARRDRTRLADLENLRRVVDGCGVQVVGAVMNRS